MGSITVCTAFLLLGFISITIQVLTIREFLVVFFGNELCLGIILGAWFLGIAAGSATGGRITRWHVRTSSLFIMLQILLCLFPFLQISIIRVIRLVLLVPPGEYIGLLHFIPAAVLITLPFSFTNGLIFPCACTLLEAQGKKMAQHIGLVYAFEAVGSLTGGIMLTFYLIARFKPFEILTGMMLLVLCNAFLICLWHKSSRNIILAISCIAICIVAGYLLIAGQIQRFDQLLLHKRWDSYKNKMELRTSVDSHYQNIVIAWGDDQYSVFGNGQYLMSFPDPYQAALLTHTVISQHPDPSKILLVGGGISGMIREMLNYPIKHLHYVELDPMLVESCLPYMADQDMKALEDIRVDLFFSDGRYYIQHTAETYDMIILNLPDPSTAMLNRFYTLEFFKEVKKRLAAGGVLVTGIAGSETYLGEVAGMYASSLYHTLSMVFPYIAIAPGTKIYFFAAEDGGIVSSDPTQLARRYENRNILSEYFSPHHFKMFFPEDRILMFLQSAERQHQQLNTDNSPITYFYNLILWENIAGSKRGAQLLQNLSGRIDILILPLMLLFAIKIVYMLVRSSTSHLSTNALLAIAAAGFAGMALEIILLFAFQNIYGYMYRQVGLLVALFMFGLAIGAGIMIKLIAGRERSWISILTLIALFIGLYAISLPYLLELVSHLRSSAAGSRMVHVCFPILIVIAGCLTGMEFPLVGRIFIDRYAAGAVAGKVNMYDHVGACLGALLTGTILVPILGVRQSCLITGLFNLMSGTLLLLSRWREAK